MSQRQDDQRNLLIAVVLSMAVMLGWQFFYAGPQIKAQQEKAQREAQAKKAAEDAAAKGATPSASVAPTTPGTASPSTAQPSASLTSLPTKTREEALGGTERHPIETPSLK